MSYTLKEVRYTKYAISGTSTPFSGGDVRSYVKTYYDQTTDDKANNRSRLRLIDGIQIANAPQILDGSTLLTKINNSTKISQGVGGNYSVGTHDIRTVSDIFVYHNSDGTGSYTINHSCFGKSFAVTLGLPTIILQSTISASPTAQFLGQSINISISRHQSSYTHNIYYQFGTSSIILIASGVETNCSFTPQIQAFSQLLTNNVSGICTIYCDTFNGSIQVGSRTSVAVTLTIPATIVPTISLTAIEGNGSVVPSAWNCYVKNKSKIIGAITGTGIYGSTISSYYATANNSKYYTSSFTTDLLSVAGSNSIYAKVTDSRARIAEITQNIEVVDYFEPTISYLKIERCNSDGTTNSNGHSIKVITTYAIAPVNNGTSNCNSKALVIKYKEKGSYDDYTSVPVTLTDYSHTELATIINNFNISKAYEFVLELSDYFSTVPIDGFISTVFKPISVRRKGKGVTFGQIATEDGLHSHMDSNFHKSLNIIDDENETTVNVGDMLNEINSNLIKTLCPGIAATNSTAEKTLFEGTLAKAGIYLFFANIPINYYGMSGRDLYTKLYFDGVASDVTDGVINSSTYTLSRPVLLIQQSLTDNIPIRLIIQSSTTATYAVGAFKLTILRLR